MGIRTTSRRHLIPLVVVALIASVGWQNGADPSLMGWAQPDAEGASPGRFNQLFFRAEPAAPTSVLYPADWHLTYDPVVRKPSRTAPHILLALSSMTEFIASNSCRESIRQLAPDQAAVIAVEAGPGWSHDDWETCHDRGGVTLSKKEITTGGRTVLLVTALGSDASPDLRGTAERVASEIEPMEFR